jgi:hypothetical protein
MDHVIDGFEVYIECAFEDFYAEWKTGEYKKYSDCPSYGELRTLLDSVNILRKYMSWDNLRIKDMIYIKTPQ